MLIKRLASYVLIAVVLFITFYFLHGYVVQKVGAIHPFSLFEVYVFNFLFSIITVVIFDLLATYTIRFKDQLGFLYLATMIAKIGLFCIVFKESLFAGVPLVQKVFLFEREVWFAPFSPLVAVGFRRFAFRRFARGLPESSGVFHAVFWQPLGRRFPGRKARKTPGKPPENEFPLGYVNKA